ncbi:Dcm Site-specific DNA methylase [uncultured Caudovirales phage]|uniref:Dcm Site-specific DNA methylase n=1 Tax=uncultured Caudovirales phage TaxID=2100421 RepID=A0A6J5SML8_9CAUD|nr:Dcm Site-specific DNA methylase [uncultured Caudovirales phage]
MIFLKKKFNVLSLFDGMSCGQQALQRAGLKVDNYFASEIDKYAIQVTMANYPNTKQLGSVTQVDGYSLPKIDLMLGGSPCQSFSFAGKRKGMSTKCETEILTLEHYLQLKSDGFEFEGQSYLFWEYMRLLNECKPTYFLLENVEMGEKWEKVLSKAIGVNGIHINSALVSAQNRRRLYWTNIGMESRGLFGYMESIIEQPKDKGILLKDILESEVDEKYFLSEKAITKCLKSTANADMLTTENKEKSGCLIAGYYKTPFDGTYIRDKQFTGLDLNAKSRTIRNGATATDKHNWDLIVHNTMPRSSTTGKGGTGPLSRADGKTYCLDTGNTNAVEIVAMRGRGDKGKIEQQLERNGTNKSNSLTTVTKDNLVRQLNPSKESGGKQPYQQNRIYDTVGISPALCANKSDLLINTSRIRRLTPIECERLQTVADNFTAHVSDSQRYKMLGNGWTIDVICHIFSYMKF